MAGATVQLDYKINDREVIRAFKRLEQAGGNTQTMFADIGEHLLISHEDRFGDQESPQGEPWAPLSDSYKKRKKKNKDKILQFDSYLKDTLAYDPSDNELDFFSNREYTATHQFGDESRNIPARPFLGISLDDEAAILDIIENHYQSALSGE